MELVLVNENFENFSCIGGDCEESCCKGWNINIGKTTYDLYMTAADDTVMNFTENLILVPETERTEYQYATIKHCKGSCIFLSEEGLCKIHSRYGSMALSNICNTFPRMVNSVNNKFELSWTTSCPEVVRFMQKKEKGNAVLADASKFLSGVFSLAHIFNKEDYRESWQYYLPEIRELINQIFSKQDFLINQRLFVIGKVIYDIQQIIDGQKYSMISNYLNTVDENKLILEFSSIKKNSSKNSEFLYGICCRRAESDYEYKKRFYSVIENYRLCTASSDNESANKFNYFMENYLSNRMMMTIFPYCADNNMFFEFKKLLIDYALLRFHLMLYFLDNQPETSENLVNTVVGYSKSISHDKVFLDEIYDSNPDFLEFENMMSLLK